MAKVYVGLGTNLGDKEQNLKVAVQKIEEQIGKVVSLSAFYITAPWGFTSENVNWGARRSRSMALIATA